jgi:large subunit ribosomal protein L4
MSEVNQTEQSALEAEILDHEGNRIGRLPLDARVFGATVNEALLWEQIRAQRASARRGTHATKTRAHVSGGGIKPYKQKGTGRARQGSIRSPNYVGGGVVFGPHPRDYSYRLPRSARRAALRSALSGRTAEQHTMILADFPLSRPSTKAGYKLLCEFNEARVLVVGDNQEMLDYSVRNLPHAKYIDVAGLNVFDVVKYPWLMIAQSALPKIIARALPLKELKLVPGEA